MPVAISDVPLDTKFGDILFSPHVQRGYLLEMEGQMYIHPNDVVRLVDHVNRQSEKEKQKYLVPSTTEIGKNFSLSDWLEG